MSEFSWTSRSRIGGGERVFVKTADGTTILEPEFDLDFRAMRHVAGPALDESVIDDLWADYDRLEANSLGVPLFPKHYVRHLEAA